MKPTKPRRSAVAVASSSSSDDEEEDQLLPDSEVDVSDDLLANDNIDDNHVDYDLVAKDIYKLPVEVIKDAVSEGI